MSRTSIFIPLVFLCAQLALGQTQIRALSNGTIYQGNAFSLDQWQWQISSSQYAGQAALIQVTVFDQSGQLVYRIAGHPFPLAGQASLSGARLNREETQFIAPAYQRSLQQLQCLPQGKYSIESVLFLVDAPDNRAIARHQQIWYQRQPCTVAIVPLAPANEASICASFPLFQWTAALPANSLQYEFSLYEHLPDQDAAEAVQLNPPIVQEMLQQPIYQPGPTAPVLQKGHRYSWRILARESGLVVGRSPLRSFTYGCEDRRETPKEEGPPPRLMYLRAGENGNIPAYTLAEPVLNFSFVQRVPQDKFQLEIIDENGNTLAQRNLTTKTGHNYLSLPFSDLGLPTVENGRKLMVRLVSNYGHTAGFSVQVDYSETR